MPGQIEWSEAFRIGDMRVTEATRNGEMVGYVGWFPGNNRYYPRAVTDKGHRMFDACSSLASSKAKVEAALASSPTPPNTQPACANGGESKPENAR